MLLRRNVHAVSREIQGRIGLAVLTITVTEFADEIGLVPSLCPSLSVDLSRLNARIAEFDQLTQTSLLVERFSLLQRSSWQVHMPPYILSDPLRSLFALLICGIDQTG